jgi:hypothetical protein
MASLLIALFLAWFALKQDMDKPEVINGYLLFHL